MWTTFFPTATSARALGGRGGGREGGRERGEERRKRERRGERGGSKGVNYKVSSNLNNEPLLQESTDTDTDY